MSLSEYRLGNIVRNNKGTVCTISQLDGLRDEVGMSYSCDPPGFYYGNTTPIKLTDEILNIIGFKKEYVKEISQSVYAKDGIYLTEDLRLCAFNGELSIISQRKRYIHELQNLYFELSGQEIAIDIKLIS